MDTIKLPSTESSTHSEIILRNHLVNLLRGGHAFLPFEKVVGDIPYDQVHLYPDDIPYTIWQQVKHLQLAQRDILEFSRNPEYKEPEWPEDYWPKAAGPSSEDEWHETLQKIQDDRESMIELIKDDCCDLYEDIPNGSGQTLLREALLIAEHNAYHTGQILIIKRLMGLHNG